MGYYTRVLVCGGRDWGVHPDSDYSAYDYSNGPQFDWVPEAKIIAVMLEGLRARAEHLTVIQGCAPGADSVAWWWADKFADEHLKFPADWKKYGKSAGPIRNRQMLEEGKPTLVLAFTHDLDSSKGTKNMVTQARKAGVRTYVLEG